MKALSVVAAAVFIATALFAQQGLVCPPSAATAQTACEAFHYHVQMYRPEPRGFVDATATPRFATQAACEQVREAHIARNLAVVQYFKKKEQQYEADRFGPCHCDLTHEKTNPAFLNETQRTLQMRAVEDVRLRVRERLLDSGLNSGDELVRGLIVRTPSLPLLASPKLVSLPAASGASNGSNSTEELLSTKALEAVKPSVASLDLPLADVADVAAPPAEANAAAEPSATADGAAASGETTPSTDQDVAAAFIEKETERIQGVLSAAASIADDSLKNRVLESALQRTQVLSNLRTLIEGSGVKSRVAAAARDAQSEADRLALVSALFGDEVAARWAPQQVTDVVLAPDRDIDSEPERVLRDRGGRYSEQQKKRALYTLLSRSQPSAEQQLWLITVVDSFLR